MLERVVEIQSNTCVDKAVFGGFTVVGQGSKVDNLVHIAHNVRLGPRNRVVAGAMVAGSVVTGEDVWIGPMASISSELTVGDRAAVSLGAVVTRSVPADTRVSGNFAIDHARFIAFLKTIR
jgi:UDP-3-O-[3-hydroxymyristoyl] glucosamine N-acyltransferase